MKRLATYVPGILTLLALLFLFQSCEDAREKGSFYYVVDGAFDQQVRGQAIFGGAVDPHTMQEGFALILTDGTLGKRLSGESLYLAILQSGRPATGTYDVVNPNDSARVASGFWGYGLFDRERVINFVTQEGTITINTSTEDEISGTFQFALRGYDFSVEPAELQGIRVTGKFTAEGGNAYIPEL